MLLLSLSATLLVASIASPAAQQGVAPTLRSEAHRLGLSQLELRRALRGRMWVQPARREPLYCFEDRLSAPSEPHRICRVKAEWRALGMEPVE